MERPQLRMIHKLERLAPAKALPSGYLCREADESDVENLGALISAAFNDRWSNDRVNEVLLQNKDVPKTWVIEWEGQLVATASYQLIPNVFPESGWVHYVAADSAHSGRGLGFIVSWTVVETALREGMKDVRLTTDDWRLPAINTYLKLGFEPDMWHETHPDRWEAVLQTIAKGS